jgi:tetratricopeptide (TPR) repeat protein
LFQKAIQLNPSQAVYFNNFADAVYVLRKSAMSHYGLSEQETLAKVLGLYSNSVRLDPRNYAFASGLAQTFYAMRPFPAGDALQAWSNALATARTPVDQQDAHVHLARVRMLQGRLDQARAQLALVTNAQFAVVKSNLFRAIAEREKSPDPPAR